MSLKRVSKQFIICLLTLFILAGCNDGNQGYHEVTSIEKAIEDAGFEIEVPEELASSIQKTINVYDAGMIEIIYLNLNHHETGRIRKAVGDKDVTDFLKEKYDKEEIYEYNDIEYTLFTTKNMIYLVSWKDSGYSYCMYIVKGKYTTEIDELLDMTK